MSNHDHLEQQHKLRIGLTPRLLEGVVQPKDFYGVYTHGVQEAIHSIVGTAAEESAVLQHPVVGAAAQTVVAAIQDLQRVHTLHTELLTWIHTAFSMHERPEHVEAVLKELVDTSRSITQSLAKLLP